MFFLSFYQVSKEFVLLHPSHSVVQADALFAPSLTQTKYNNKKDIAQQKWDPYINSDVADVLYSPDCIISVRFGICLWSHISQINKTIY